MKTRRGHDLILAVASALALTSCDDSRDSLTGVEHGPLDLSADATPVIVFESDRFGDEEVFVMSATGDQPTRITYSPGRDFLAQWSRDRMKIAFTSERDGNFEIYVMNADGSGQTNLTNSPSEEAHPSWSPDGQKIVFDSDRDGNREIYVMNADGSHRSISRTRPTGSSGIRTGPRTGRESPTAASTTGMSEPESTTSS